MKRLKTNDVLLLHNLVVDATGGSHGVRDMGLLESAVERMHATYGGAELYENIFLKGAALLHSLLMNHPFVDGNKRTAMYSGMSFMELNGYTFTASQAEIVSFALRIENDKLDVEQIAGWLKTHSKPLDK